MRAAAALMGVAGLAACASAGPAALTPVEARLHQDAIAFATASQVARACPALIPDVPAMIDRAREGLDLAATDPISDARLRQTRAARQADAMRAFDAFVARHALRGGDAAAFCAAGRTEMRAGSAVGRLLKPAA